MVEQRKTENVLKIYFLINLGFILLHPMLIVVTVMGLGSASGDVPRVVIIKAIMVMASVGASPNFLMLLTSLIRRKQMASNLLWSLLFSTLIFSCYFAFFWQDILSAPV